MHDIQAKADQLQIIFHNDHDTPMGFVVELLHSVFKKPIADAVKFMETVDKYGQAICGIYARDVANAALQAAYKRILASGYPLLITSQEVAAGDETHSDHC